MNGISDPVKKNYEMAGFTFLWNIMIFEPDLVNSTKVEGKAYRCNDLFSLFQILT